MTPQDITLSLAGTLGWPDAPTDRIDIAPTATGLATWMPIADMAAGAQGLVGLASEAIHRARGGGAQRISVDRWAASLSMTASGYLTVDGEKKIDWDPLTGYFAVADGWVYLHCQFPHLRERLLTEFGWPNDADTVRAGLAALSGQEVEDRCAAAGVCGIMRRDRATWEAHPQARELAKTPVVRMDRLDGDGSRVAMHGPGEAPLSGLRVLDLSRVIAGPTMGRTLAEHGAEVLRISAPDLPYFEGLAIDTGFGKRSAHCDLGTEAGRAALAELIRDADVMIDGFRPGALAGRGFGMDALRKLNPGLVYLTLSAFGETGPWGGRRGYDTYVQCATGLSQDGPDGPTRLPCQPLDYLSGYLGAAAAMVALRRRMQEGGFWRIELALARTAMWVWEMTDRLPPEDAPPAANPTLEAAAPILDEIDSAFGRIRAMRPAVSLSATPPSWRSAPVPLGSDAPVWRS